MTTSQIIATHGEDPDGIIAHALLLRALEISDQTLSPETNHFLRYDRLVEQFKGINSLVQDGKTSLYIADVGLNPLLAGENGGNLIIDLLQNPRQVMWIDHHLPTIERKSLFDQFGGNLVYCSKRSSGFLTKTHFNLNSDYDTLLGGISQAHDYKRPGRNHTLITLGDELQRVISYANALPDESSSFELLSNLTTSLRDDKIIRGSRLSSDWEDLIIEYEFLQQQAFHDLEESLEFENIAGHEVLWAVSSPYLSQKIAPRYLESQYSDSVDLCVTIFTSPVRNHIIDGYFCNGLSIGDICKSLGGGGRGNGGGFSVPYDTTEKTIPQIKELVREQIELYSPSNCRSEKTS